MFNMSAVYYIANDYRKLFFLYTPCNFKLAKFLSLSRVEDDTIEYILKSQSVYTLVMVTTVRELMRKKVFTIEESDSIQNTAIKMNDKKVSSLLVVDSDGKPTGLVTERDLVRKVCINDVRTSQVKNKEIMSAPLITIDSKSSPSIAADLMLKNNVRHLLVVDDNSKDANKLIGMITPLDFTKYEEYERNDEDKESIEMILEYYI